MWIVAGDRSKIVVSDQKKGQISTFDLPLTTPFSFFSFYVDKEETVWCGGNAKLTSYNLRNNQRREYLLTDEANEKPLTGRIHSIHEDQEGRFWISGRFGLRQFDKKSGKILETGYNKTLFSALEDSKGNLWFGGYEGIQLLRKGSSELELLTINRPNSDNLKTVRQIIEDPSGRIWFAVEDGLHFYSADQNKILPLSNQENKILDNVFDIESDNQGYIWVNAESKLIRYHPDKKTIQIYDQKDGLPYNAIIPSKAIVKDVNGKLHFYTNRQIFSLDPESISPNETPSPIVLSSLKLFNENVAVNDKTGILNQPIDQIKEITFRHDQNIFTLDFAILSYARLEKNQYAYKLEGLENDWNYVTSNPSATYSNLPYGKYTFLVKAANGDGYWNETPMKFGITVLPPWWKTWYAYIFYLFLTLAVIYSINRILWLRKSIQKENELYQSKLDFFTNISHEIRTHLSLIINPLDKVAQSADITSTDHTYLTYARTNSGRLMHLVNELLDFRKIQNGGSQLHISDHDLGAMLKNVASAFEHVAKEKDIVTSIHLPEQPVILWFDAIQMQKVFFNLLSNSYKFIPEGGHVMISVTETSKDVNISFTDNGKGISPENLAHLFTNFFQVSDHNKNNTGYGIGLALSKGIVDQHFGDLTVTSQVATETNQGMTTFTLSLLKGYTHFNTDQLSNHLPVLYTEPANSSFHASENIQVNQLEKKTLLLIEDNEELRAFTRESFQDLYHVIESPNGTDALKTAREVIPDIIICDVMIPEPNGLEVTSILKSDMMTNHIPIILLTARGTPYHVIEGLKTGADDYLIKPFNLNILQLKIQNLIQGRELLMQRYKKSILLSSDTIITNNVDEEFIQKLNNILVNHITDPKFGVNELAFEVGVSLSVLYRKVRAITGMTINELMKTIRMKRAMQLLEEGTFNVNEVAIMIGYEDRKYFSREFKKHFDKTPTEIRKKTNGDVTSD